VAYVDTQTGIAIDQTISQEVVVNVVAGAQSLSLIPLLALNFTWVPDSMKYLADKANSAGRRLMIMKVIAAISLIVIGVVLVLIAVIRRKKPTQPGPASPPNVDAHRPSGYKSASTAGAHLQRQRINRQPNATNTVGGAPVSGV
jgi:hypothetical protein